MGLSSLNRRRIRHLKPRRRRPMFRVNFPGPFTHHDVVVDGWTVPLVEAQPCGENDENVMLILDKRIAITLSVAEAERFVPFLADAISVALGYAAHPNEET